MRFKNMLDVEAEVERKTVGHTYDSVITDIYIHTSAREKESDGFTDERRRRIDT